MSSIEKSIEVNVPASTAYNQWTQFEEFPQFMGGVVSVKQLDDRHLLWKTNVGGKEQQFEAEIAEQIPDKRIAWRSISDNKHAGVVTFHHLDDQRCKVMLQIDYEPEGLLEKAGDLVGIMSARVSQDLANFKQFIESRGHESGAWRGEIPSP